MVHQFGTGDRVLVDAVVCKPVDGLLQVAVFAADGASLIGVVEPANVHPVGDPSTVGIPSLSAGLYVLADKLERAQGPGEDQARVSACIIREQAERLDNANASPAAQETPPDYAGPEWFQARGRWPEAYARQQEFMERPILEMSAICQLEWMEREVNAIQQRASRQAWEMRDRIKSLKDSLRQAERNRKSGR